MATLSETDHGVGYGHNEYADTTAPRERLEQLARLVGYGLPDDHRYGEYRYVRASDEDAAPMRPALYPIELDEYLRASLRQARTWDQAFAIVEMFACQLSQTGCVSSRNKRYTTREEREWAHRIFAASRAKTQLERVPGTCRGCNSTPCRCLA